MGGGPRWDRDQDNLRLYHLARTDAEAEAKHKLVLLEKELLQDHLGKKPETPGDSRDRMP